MKGNCRFLLCLFVLLTLSACKSDVVFFRGNQASFNSVYYARITDEGGIEVKAKDSNLAVGGWTELELPDGLAGDVTELAMDDEHIIALNGERQIYTMWKANKQVEDFHWQKRWGFPFWNGPGMQLKEDILKWDFSVVSREEDGFWTDPAGNLHEVGFAKCSHIIMLNEGGNTLTFNDPWLPRDYSYEIGMPKRGTFIAQNVSSSGSTHFIINRYGDMYTRLFDFDISGLDSGFMPTSYEDQRGLEKPVIQMPAEEWAMHPKIKLKGQACITDRISLHKVGQNCVERIMRVEGLNAKGQSGFYEKKMSDKSENAWTFVVTKRPLQGNRIESLEGDTSGEDLAEKSEDRIYERNADLVPELIDNWSWRWIYNWEWAASINDFNCYQSPARVTFFVADEEFDLKLHYCGTIRLLERERGLNDNPRKFVGAFEVPAELRNLNDDSPTAQFIEDYFDNRQWTEVNLSATLDKLHIDGIAKHGRVILWDFEDGRWAD